MITELTPGSAIYQESNLAVLFFRPEVLTEELDLSSLQQDVMCLELKLTDLTAMLALISQLYLPMVEQEALALQNIPQSEIDSYRRSLNEHLEKLTCLVEKSEPHLNILFTNTKLFRDDDWMNSPMAHQLSTTVLQDWLSTVHSHLTDVIDTPNMDMETQSSPLEELRKWNARQRIFSSILKQMRCDHARSIVRLLSSSKPDLVHIWTDAETQVIQVNSVAKNKLVFLNSINKHFSTMLLHSSSLEALNANLSTINSNSGLFVGFQLPSQRGYLGYVYYKLVCEIIRQTSRFLLSGKPTLDSQVQSPWFYLDTSSDIGDYKDFIKLLNEVLKLEDNLAQHISILKEKGLLRNLSRLSGKKESAISEDQNLYKEFSDIEMLLSPLRKFSGHVRSLLKLNNDIVKLVELCNKLTVYPSCPEVTWGQNPMGFTSVEIAVSKLPKQDDEFIQKSPSSPSSRKKRPIGSGKMGILLEVDEDKNFDTPSLSRRDSDSDGLSDIFEIESEREHVQRVYTRFSEQIKGWLEDNLEHVCKRFPTGPAFLYEPTSSNYESFDKVLDRILNSLDILNNNIEITFTEITNSQFCMNEQLALLDIFCGWAVDPKATEFSKFYLAKAFSQFEEKMLSLEQRFVEDKITPSKLLDISRVTESVLWSRLLLEKLEEPILRLSKYEVVLKNAEYVESFNKYRNFKSDLKQYEKIWIKFSQEAVKEITKQQQNKLLLVPQESDLIRVNLNPIIFITIRELKSLIKVGVSLTSKSDELLFSGERLKLNYDRANFVKSEFSKIHSQIPEYLIPLYEPRLKLFLKYLQPGWTHLTWKNINLDIFFETANRELFKLNASVKDVIVFISSAKDIFHSSVACLPTILRDLLTSENSISIEQFQNLFASFISKTQSKIRNMLLTFQSVICQLYLKINQSNEEYESYSPEELLKVVSKKLESDPHSSSMKSFLQFYNTWSHDTILTWTMDQFEQYLNLISFTLCREDKRDFLEKQLSNLNSEATLTFANLHTFVISSDFNEIVKSFAKHRLRISCEVIFEVPFVVSVPSYESISDTILACFDQLVTVFASLFNSSCAFESNVITSVYTEKLFAAAENIKSAIKSNLNELVNPLRCIFKLFSNFDSIRRGELFQTYEQIRTHSDYLSLSTNIVHSLFDILIFLRNLVQAFNLGILKVSMAPLQTSLSLLIQMWKDKFSSYLLDSFESQLKDAILKREMIHTHLDRKVENIIDLDVVLKYLRDVFNLEFTIESTFSQIEASYQLLDSYEVTIQREFLEEVSNLRKNWQFVIERAKGLQENLITQNYLKYEREIEREMKTFEIKTIQLLKEFEAEGPCVAGIDAETAKSRLNAFSERYTQFLSKKELLSSLQTTYFIPTSNYSDLDKVGKEISILQKLYLLYENLCAFEKDTNAQPWIFLQFDICQKQMIQFNEEFEELDISLSEWDAYRYIQRTINMYFEVLPILRKLQDPTFKPRHWLRLMSLGSKHFTINPQKLTLQNVLKLNLVQHSIEIDEICKKAIAEAEVDKTLKNISNDLQDQVFVFIYPQDQVPQVSIESVSRVLEVLDDHYVTLSTALTSRYISHFLREATLLSSNIKTTQTFINNLTYSQTLALQLDSIFKNNQTDFRPSASFNEAQINFVAAFKRWKKQMKKIEEPSNILACCCYDDQIRDQLECNIKELENCRLLIEEYLESIRASYPFLYFLSDHDLLDLLKHQANPNAMVPHIKPFFPQINQFTYEEKPRRRSVIQIDTEIPVRQINGFISSIGEEILLKHCIPVVRESYHTINDLMKETRRTLQIEFSDFVKESREKKMPNADYELFMFTWEQLTTQVALISLHSIWTKNLQEAIINFRSHKNALSEATTLFFQHVSRLLALVHSTHPSKNQAYFRSKLECIVFYGLWLRDIGYDLAEKKPRDVSDFEWQRYLRMYYHSSPGLTEYHEMVESNETLNLTLRCLFTNIPYGFDYIGYATPNIFLTSSMKTIHLIYLSILEQRHTQFKTNLPLEFMHSAKEFSRIHGKHFMQLRIHENFSPKAMSCFLYGTLLSKSWGLVNGWNSINNECLSIFTSIISRLHARNFASESNQSIPNESAILMLVTNIDHFLVCNLRPFFKSCSYLPPNDYYILKLYCLARGIRASKQLIDKMLWFKDILPILYPETSHVRFTIPFFISILNHISAEKHRPIGSRRCSIANSETNLDIDFRFRPRRSSVSHSRALKQLSHRSTFGNILNISPDEPTSPNVPNKEQRMIASFLVDTCVPRFQPEVHSKFLSLVDTVFGTSHSSAHSDNVAIPNFGSVFTKVCSEMKIISTSILEQQVKAIHSAANTYHGFILFGKPGTGKSTAFSVYINCLKNFTGDITNDTVLKYSHHKTYHIYTQSLYSQESLIGREDDKQCWRDGVLSQAVRYANTDSKSLIWIVIDDIIQSPLFEFLSSCMFSSSLTLSNGQSMPIPCNVRFILETINLSSLSLSYLNLFQMIYFPVDAIQFDSFVMLSIQKYPRQLKNVIYRALQKIMGVFIRDHLSQYPPINEFNMVSLYKTFFIYFDQLISNFLNCPGQTEPITLSLIERFALFALISSFGIHLEEYRWASFTRDLYSLSDCLPDLDSGLTIFDYCISNLGDWDTLHMVYSDSYPAYSITCNGDIIVKCTNLYRVNMLAELCASSERPIMVIGPHSSGKSSLIKNLIYSKSYDDITHDVLHQAIDHSTTVASLYDSLYSRLECRYLDTYGPPKNHKLNLFIDDLHIGQSTVNANSPVQEFIRCMIEAKGCFSDEFPTKWLNLIDVFTVCAMTSDRYLPWTHTRMSQHFNVIRLYPEAITQDTAYHLLDALTQPEGVSKYSPEVLVTLTKTSQTLNRLVSTIFQPTDILGRSHYYFSWKDLSLIFHGFKVCADELLEGENEVFNLLYHITNRVYSAQLCNLSDLNTLKCMMEKQWKHDASKTKYIENAFDDIPYFTTLVEEHKPDTSNALSQSLSHAMEINTNIILHPTKQLDQLIKYVTKLQNQHNDKYVERPCISMLTLSDIKQLDYLNFLLSFPKSNILFVGRHMIKLSDISRLAYFAAGFEYLELILETKQSFIDGIKSAIRQAALGSKSVGFVITSDQLQLHYVRDLFNTYLVTGHVDHVFAFDEFNSLVSSIEPIYKRLYANTYTDARQYFSVQIQKNLKVIICIETHHPMLKDFELFPGLVKGCYVSIYKDWCGDSIVGDMVDLVNLPESNIALRSLPQDFSIEFVIILLSTIHNSFIKQDRDLNFLERVSSYPKNAFDLLDPFSEREARKQSSSNSLFQHFFEDNVQFLQDYEKARKDGVSLVGGFSLQRFIKVFFTMFINELRNNERKSKSLKRCLSARQDLQGRHEKLLREVERIDGEIVEKDTKCESLLEKLSQISCKIESIKVFSSDSDSNILRATLATIRSQDEAIMELLEFEEDKELIIKLLENETQLKQSSIDKQTRRQNKRVEELQAKVDENMKLVNVAENEVKLKFIKITRSTLENVKSLHNPPKQVIPVLESLVFLVSRHHRAQSCIPNSRFDSSFCVENNSDVSCLLESNQLQAHHPKLARQQTHQANRGPLPVAPKGSAEAWNSIQQAIGQDAQKFLDALASMTWKFGLDREVIQYIEKNFATSRNTAQQKAGTGFITVQSAKHAAEGAGVICAYITALAEYNYIYKQHCVLEEEIYQINSEISQMVQQQVTPQIDLPTLTYEKRFIDEEQVAEYDLDSLQKELNEVEAEFHKAVYQQHQLKEEFVKQKTLTQSLYQILESTEALKSSWQQSFDSLYDTQTLMYYCIVTALLISYLGPTPPFFRKIFFDDAFNKISSYFDDSNSQTSFSYSNYNDFLTQMINRNFDTTDIPDDTYVQENLSLIFNPYLPNFPLIIDPYGIFLSWIKDQSPYLCISYFATNLPQILDDYSMQAKKVVIFDVEPEHLSTNQFILKILIAKTVKHGFTRKPNFAQIDTIHPSFQLFLVSPIKREVPYSLLAVVTPVLFIATRDGFAKDLGRVCLSVLEPLKYSEMRENESRLNSSSKIIKSLENELSNAICISFQVDNMVAKCKTITSNSSEYQANKEIYQISLAAQNSLLLKNALIFDGGEVAGIVFDILRCMPSLNENYQSSYPTFKQFLRGINEGYERVDPRLIPDIILRFCYSFMNQSFSENDRIHFALMLAIEYEIYRKQARRSDAEMLFSALYPIKHNTKKPFDWMQEKQWDNLNAMGQSVKKIQEAVDRMAREGRATQWRTFCENDSPEEPDFPDGLNNTLSPMEKLLILKCVKQDNLKNSITRFIDKSLGVDLIKGSQIDYNFVLSRLITPQTPILIFSNHPLYTMLLLNNITKYCNSTMEIISLYGDSSEDITQVFEVITSSSIKGNWVFIQNVDLNMRLMEMLPLHLDSLTSCHESFRVWFGCTPTSSLDLLFVKRCIRLYLGIPFEPKNSAINCLELLRLNDNILKITRSEWTPILHSLIMVHVACRYRVILSPSSFEQEYRWSIDSLVRSLRLVLLEIEQCASTMLTYSQQNKPFSWPCVRYMIGELTYGSGLVYPQDIELLNGMLDYWLNANSIKPNYEFPRSQHRPPNAFFKNHPKPRELIHGFLTETSLIQLRSPEVCGLFSKSQFFSPDTIVNNTKILNDTLKFYRLEDQPIAAITQTIRETMSLKVAKFRGTKKRSTSIFELTKRVTVDKTMERSTSLSTSTISLNISPHSFPNRGQFKDLLIHEKCSSLLSDLPHLDNINVYISRCEQFSNQYLQSFFIQELSTWRNCIGEIRSDLQTIQNYLLFSKIIGVSSGFFRHIRDLHENCVPSKWQKLIGPSAPPDSQTFSTWFDNLKKRYQYLFEIIDNGNLSCYNLGYFFYPGQLLASFCLLKSKTDNLNFEKSCLIGEITTKEKEHVKDPPAIGIYASEISVNGCVWDKNSGEFIDTPSTKSGNTVLPLVHITRAQANQLSNRKEGIRGPHLYYCPVYRNEKKKDIFFHIKIQNNEIPRIRWMMRGLTCTLQHY